MCQRMAGGLTEMKKTAGRSGWASGYPGGGGRRRGGYPGGGGGPISWWRPNQHESSQGIQGLRYERYGFETRRPGYGIQRYACRRSHYRFRNRTTRMGAKDPSNCRSACWPGMNALVMMGKIRPPSCFGSSTISTCCSSRFSRSIAGATIG